MTTFIRITEVWVPSQDGALLELASGLYGAAPAFGAVSREMCFGRAEGLPGRAWEEGRPILLPQLAGSYFRRAEAAQVAGLDCALAWPIFKGEALTCVVVFLCGASPDRVGAIELWRNDPRITGDLTLAEGYFGNTGEALPALSRDSYLPRGSGLPGLAWQKEAAVFLDRVAESSRFLRTEAAHQAGLVRGLAVPCSTPDARETWVMSLLSSQASPIAQRIESWAPDAHAMGLRRNFGFCEQRETLPSGALLPNGVSPALEAACASGVAAVTADLPPNAREAGLVSMLALPVLSDGVVSEVLALYW